MPLPIIGLIQGLAITILEVVALEFRLVRVAAGPVLFVARDRRAVGFGPLDPAGVWPSADRRWIDPVRFFSRFSHPSAVGSELAGGRSTGMASV
jgi:hypothetical protein